jgi:nucleotide-binding universal stress UspA family protein
MLLSAGLGAMLFGASSRGKERRGMVETIAVGTDGSETAQKAVEFALDMAERYGAKLVIASAYRPVPEDRLRREQAAAPQEIQWSINPSEDVDATLRAIEEQARERGLEFVSEARTGDPADVLCDIAGDRSADLLVVGSKGMQRRLLGSVPNTVSHNAPCSVLIVKTA